VHPQTIAPKITSGTRIKARREFQGGFVNILIRNSFGLAEQSHRTLSSRPGWLSIRNFYRDPHMSHESVEASGLQT
jgi:hypothetical protein